MLKATKNFLRIINISAILICLSLIITLFFNYYPLTVDDGRGDPIYPDAVLGAYDATGAAIVLVGTPLILLVINERLLK